MKILGGTDEWYKSQKLAFLNGLEEQIILASTSVLAEWERIGLINRINEIKLALIPVEQVETRKVEQIA